jgi:hypothetical protein
MMRKIRIPQRSIIVAQARKGVLLKKGIRSISFPPNFRGTCKNSGSARVLRNPFTSADITVDEV